MNWNIPFLDTLIKQGKEDQAKEESIVAGFLRKIKPKKDKVHEQVKVLF